MKIQEPISAESAHYRAVSQDLEGRRDDAGRAAQFAFLLGCAVGALSFLGLVATYFASH